jgi:hypothetical protein
VDGVKYRSLKMLTAATTWRHSSDQLRAIGDCLLGVESALFAGESLHDHTGALVD